MFFLKYTSSIKFLKIALQLLTFERTIIIITVLLMSLNFIIPLSEIIFLCKIFKYVLLCFQALKIVINFCDTSYKIFLLVTRRGKFCSSIWNLISLSIYKWSIFIYLMLYLSEVLNSLLLIDSSENLKSCRSLLFWTKVFMLLTTVTLDNHAGNNQNCLIKLFLRCQHIY